MLDGCTQRDTMLDEHRNRDTMLAAHRDTMSDRGTQGQTP